MSETVKAYGSIPAPLENTRWQTDPSRPVGNEAVIRGWRTP